MITESIYLAELFPEEVDRYCKLHDRIPVQIELHLREAGLTRLDIFLAGSTLCMLIVKDDSKEAPVKSFSQAAEDTWQAVTGACFAVSWRLAKRVYSLATQPL